MTENGATDDIACCFQSRLSRSHPDRSRAACTPPDVITVVLGVPSHLNLIWTLMEKTQGPFSWCT
jgi:hypothetical protein